MLGAVMPSSSIPPSLKHPVSTPPWYYRLVIRTLKPIYRLQVWRRSHERDNYQQEVAQRFGKQYPPVPQHDAQHPMIWCHAVSLGETNTVAPLLDRLLAAGYRLWLTNTTQTGYARGAGRFADDIAAGRMAHSYVPVDAPEVINTFLNHVQPVAALFVETELWANSLAILHQRQIPSILVNGRLSSASFARYQKIGAVSRSMMQNLTRILAQDDDSATRFKQLGATNEQVHVAGSLKWVINTPKAVSVVDGQPSHNPSSAQTDSDNDKAQTTADHRPIWVAASTHAGEETAALALQQQLLATPDLSNTLLIIVPRHPERFDEVAMLIQDSGLSMARRSKGDDFDAQNSAQPQVYLADTMGELMHWYAKADVALVGGSLVDIGGHNPVEPASVATPILMGHYTQSCQSVVDALAGVGALFQPHNTFYRAQAVDEMDNHAAVLLEDRRDRSEDNALLYLQLYFWLSHSRLAAQAGQAGADLTKQQQSVLTDQMNLITDIVQHSATHKTTRR